MAKQTKKSWYFFPALGVGVALLAATLMLRKPPSLQRSPNLGYSVITTPLVRAAIAPQVTAYGRVHPKLEWQLIPEVGGRVVEMHPDLAQGNILPQGSKLLQLDPTDYQIALARAEADRQVLKSQLDAKAIVRQNLQASLAIEQSQLNIAEQELARNSALFERKLMSQSDYDKQRQSYLVQQQRVQELSNSLALIPSDIAVLNAQLAQQQTLIRDAKRRLSQTEIMLPFDGRVAEVSAELDQLVLAQHVIAEIHGIETMEVEAQLSLADFRTLIRGMPRQASGELPNVAELGLTAHIELTGAGEAFRWPAQFDRIREGVDPVSATVGVILSVEQDYRALQPGLKPPLVNGLFVTAQIQSPERDHWLVPESALHGDRLYVIDELQQLTILPVEVLFRQQGQVAIESPELFDGMRVVTTDLLPAIEGMKLVEVQP